MQSDVLIVDAGPTGLALALTLDKLKISFDIIDKKAKPDNISKAMLVVPGTLEHYSQLGIVEEVIKSGIEPLQIFVHNLNKRVEINLGEMGSRFSRYPRLLTYPQDDHERLLLKELANRGHHISWETAYFDMKQTQSGSIVKVEKSGQNLSKTYRYIVGADGGSSTVRKSQDISFLGETNEQKFFVADVELNNDGFVGDVVHAFFYKQDFLICFPLKNKTTKRLIGILPANLSQRANIDWEDLKSFLNNYFGLKITAINWFSDYQVHHRLAASYRKGSVFLAGDAAHLHSPVGGQGMNAGIADAVNLGWKLAKVLQNKAHESLLDTYEEERKNYAQTLVSTTDRAFKFITANSQLLNKTRNFLIPLLAEYALNKTDKIAGRLYDLISQTRIQYSDSSLNASDSSNPLLGRRLPHFQQNTAYTDEMNWHVQVYGKIHEEFKTFLKTYSIPFFEIGWKNEMKEVGFLKNTAYLIRPDGYVAWVNETQNVEFLKDYIEKWQL